MELNPEINTGSYYVIEGAKGRFVLPETEVGELPTGSKNELGRLNKSASANLEEALVAFTEYSSIQGITYIARYSGIVARVVSDWYAGPSPLRPFISNEEAENFVLNELALTEDDSSSEDSDEDEDEDTDEGDDDESDALTRWRQRRDAEEEGVGDEEEEEEDETPDIPSFRTAAGATSSAESTEAALDENLRAVVVKQITPQLFRLCYAGMEFDTASKIAEAKELCYDYIERSGLQNSKVYLLQDDTVKKL